MGHQRERIPGVKKRRTKCIDRTSSMSAGEIERFWVCATQEMLRHILMKSNAYDGIASLEQEKGMLEKIATETLEEIIGR